MLGQKSSETEVVSTQLQVNIPNEGFADTSLATARWQASCLRDNFGSCSPNLLVTPVSKTCLWEEHSCPLAEPDSGIHVRSSHATIMKRKSGLRARKCHSGGRVSKKVKNSKAGAVTRVQEHDENRHHANMNSLLPDIRADLACLSCPEAEVTSGVVSSVETKALATQTSANTASPVKAKSLLVRSDYSPTVDVVNGLMKSEIAGEPLMNEIIANEVPEGILATAINSTDNLIEMPQDTSSAQVLVQEDTSSLHTVKDTDSCLLMGADSEVTSGL